MTMMTEASERLLPVFRRPDVVFTRGEGAWLFDAAGRRYLDFISGLGVAALGHAHARLTAALAEQAGTLVHTSNLFHHGLQGPLLDRLTRLAGMDRAFLCNSGTEAVEACLKFARKYWHAQGTPRTGFVALEHSFHGRTMGALSVTWDSHYREPFAPLVGPVTFVSPENPGALDAAVNERTAAIVIEPIQGEGGVRPLSRDFAAAVARACRRSGALLIADEVQCGLGRTGVPFVSGAIGLTPDLMAVGKALGGGFPVAAALFNDKVAATARPGDHGTTYGGNALACRAALVFLDELIDGGLLERVREAGESLGARLRALASRHPSIVDLRGGGVMWGVQLDRDAGTVVDEARERGLLINRTATSVVRLLPPYIVTEDEIAQAVEILDAALATTGGAS
jgi:predicted acetylornithine/succinylornithine family transaminase